MSLTKHAERRALAGILLILGLAVWGCSENLITGPTGSGDPIQLSREMTLGEFEEALASGAARVRIELIGDGLVAQRVVVGYADDLAAAEGIESRIAGVQMIGADGVLTLMLGDLQVTFDPETRFSAGDDELGFEQFVDRVEAALSEGYEPFVEAERSAPDQPQGPADARFLARALRLSEEGEGPAIGINIDVENLQLNTATQDGEPDGWINVLGLSIELRVSDGVTELATQEADVSDLVEFEGLVHSVDLEAGSFTFTDGTVVKITDETQIFETDSDVQLLSLEAVHAALEEGHDVVAWGGGELESVEPRAIVALELRFAIHRDGGGGDQDFVEFEGYVTSVNFEDHSFTLTNGTIVRITEYTELIASGEGESLMSLEAVAAALDAGHDVIAYGAAEVESTEPLTLIAREMRFVLKSNGATTEDFEGFVETVHEGEGIFTLNDGTVVHVSGETQIKQADQGESLMSLGAVSEALAASQDVVAWGRGEVEGTEPLTITALEVYFVIAN
jgi:hypothetical protein